MRTTGLGHAGLFIETAHGNVLCDPWRYPAFAGSWFPNPDNRGVDWSRLADADYLYVSHRHQDHFDPRLLRETTRPDVRVLLPEYPTDDLERDLRAVGYTRILRIPASEPIDLGGLRVMITPMRGPSDGPIGDSALSLSDGRDAILDQNDAHLIDMRPVLEFAPYGAHFVQHSGAIWWPMAYDMPLRARQAFAALKRSAQRRRALYYADMVGAPAVFPFAGPPALLDDDLFHWNGLGQDDDSIFEDQGAFLRALAASGAPGRGHRFLPGTVVDLVDGEVTVRQTLYDEDLADQLERDPWPYLREQQRLRAVEIRDARPRPSDLARDPDRLLSELRARLEPFMLRSPHIAAALAGGVSIDLGVLDVVLDFVDGRVRRHDGERARYRFSIPADLVAAALLDGEVDWCNGVFLSMRFTTSRIGKFNEHLYAFFSALSDDRAAHIAEWYRERERASEVIRLGAWEVQRRCPHLGVDLADAGRLDGDVLVCEVHGWRFDLVSGRCLTTEHTPIHAVRWGDVTRLPIGDEPGAIAVPDRVEEAAEPTGGAVGECAVEDV